MMTELNKILTLNEVVKNATNKTISLPTVQRGFVWKPYQIENLWDSLLRGYPVGSFVLSKKINSEKEFELLDGQQRASAICLGFYNPLNESAFANHEIFKTSNDNIMIFIDLLKPSSENDNRKYLFRVITKSHPWGYRKQENQKILESKDRNAAMGFYRIENNEYFNTPLKHFWPFDSYEPIPIGLFINAAVNKLSLADLEKEIRDWRKELRINEGVKLKAKNGENILCYTIEEIYNDVQKMLKKQEIPLLHLDASHLYLTDQNNAIEIQHTNTNDNDDEKQNKENEKSEQEKIEDRNISEVENLFIRLNSGGTPLRGEELNYSVLKAHITDPELLKNIEKKSKGLFYPARFITIAFRLFNNRSTKNSVNEADSISMNIKPKQFQRLIRENKRDKNSNDNFISFLTDFIDSGIIEKTQQLLVYSETNTIGLPKFVAHSLADKAPEIMFMLLYRLYVKKDNIAPDLKPRVLGLITLFTWLGRGEKQRDHAKLLQNIWPCVKSYSAERFWSEETVQRAMLMDGDYEILTSFPNSSDLKRIIPKDKKGENIKALVRSKIYDASGYRDFIHKMFFEKDIILYAQREALHEWFKVFDEVYLEDTNRPFDWDHICPHNYIRQKNIAQALRDWYPSNGNFRAWKYSLNRGDQDVSPANKLNPSKEDLEWWSKRLNKNYSTVGELKKDLLSWSYCVNENWLDLDSTILEKIKDYSNAKQIIKCILKRNVNMCLVWYKNLEIDKLIPIKQNSKNIIEFFESVISKKWKEKQENEERVAYYLPLGERNLDLYFSFDIEKNTLYEDYIYFGIQEPQKNSEENQEIKIPSNKTEKYQQGYENRYYYTGNYFTLNSYSEDSKIELFNQFYLWLIDFPDKKTKDLIINKFNDSIKSKYQNEIISLKRKQ